MSEVSQTAREKRQGAAADQRSWGFGWRRLQVLAVIGVLGSLLIPMLIQLSVEPFLMAMAVPFIIGLLVMLRWPRAGAIWLGVVSLAELLFSAPFLADALTQPESTADFIPLYIFTVCTLVGTVASIPSFREGRGPATGSRRAGAVAVVAGALIVAGAAASVVAAAGIESVPARRGDIRMVTEEIVFRPEAIEAEGTTVSVHVINRDSTRHTFTIDELGVDLNLPPNSQQRVSFEADPGTYRFFCRPHDPSMQGELRVQ
jgi:plastocyanin